MRFRYSIRDVLWLTLMVALAAGWLIDHKRLTGPTNSGPPGGANRFFLGGGSVAVATPAVPSSVSTRAPSNPVATASPVNRNPYNEIVTGYNAAVIPTFTGPRGGVYHYS